MLILNSGFPRWFSGLKKKKNPPASAGATEDAGSIPGWGRSPGGGNGNPPQYSCLENPRDRETWLTTVQGVAKESDMTDWAHILKWKNLHHKYSKSSLTSLTHGLNFFSLWGCPVTQISLLLDWQTPFPLRLGQPAWPGTKSREAKEFFSLLSNPR